MKNKKIIFSSTFEKNSEKEVPSMNQLEVNQIYSRDEVAAFTNVSAKAQNFKRNATNKLKNWGYEFVYAPKKIRITKAPESWQERIQEILMRQYGFDVQTDFPTLTLSIALILFNEDGFAAMPWNRRSIYLKEQYQRDVSDGTMSKWFSKLFKQNVFAKISDGAADWISLYRGKQKLQLPGEDYPEKVAEFKAYRRELLQKYQGWSKELSLELWDKFHYWVSTCKALISNAFDREIMNLIKETFSPPEPENFVNLDKTA